jgi:ribosomal protein L11 methyltransferase
MIGFDGFEQEENILKAFVSSTEFDKELLDEIATRNDLSYVQTVIQETNWNALWESNFEPVVVDDFVAVRAHFHQPIKDVEHEIVITPKMSFGTGHHATTYMMIQEMRSVDLNNKTVFDFGTGTGILAILAEKMGAAKVIAIDNDEWSIENAKENLNANNCRKVIIKKSEQVDDSEIYDVILANINKNVLLETIPGLFDQLQKEGTLLLSGLLEEDEKDIVSVARNCNGVLLGKLLRDKWICLKFGR